MPSDIAFLVVVGTIAIAGLFATGPVRLTRKCPLSEYGRCKGARVVDGLPWRPACSGHSIFCRRRRQALDDMPDGIVPDNRDI